jgi:hypothetical protein
VSAGARLSVQLNTDPRYGRWFLNLGVTYTHLTADSSIFSNGGDDADLSGSVGIGIAF